MRAVWRLLRALLVGPDFYTQRVPPTHPLRCQHCREPLRQSGHPAGGFLDPAGHVHCPGMSIRHHPMPSIR